MAQIIEFRPDVGGIDVTSFAKIMCEYFDDAEYARDMRYQVPTATEAQIARAIRLARKESERLRKAQHAAKLRRRQCRVTLADHRRAAANRLVDILAATLNADGLAEVEALLGNTTFTYLRTALSVRAAEKTRELSPPFVPPTL